MTIFLITRLIYEAYFRFPHFKIMKAGMKRWMSKTEEQITTYQIELKTKKSSDELIFEEVWIDEKKYKFQLSRENRKFAARFSEKEILKLNVLSEIPVSADITPPEKSSKGILLVGYTFKNKRKYLSVKKLNQISEMRISE